MEVVRNDRISPSPTDNILTEAVFYQNSTPSCESFEQALSTAPVYPNTSGGSLHDTLNEGLELDLDSSSLNVKSVDILAGSVDTHVQISHGTASSVHNVQCISGSMRELAEELGSPDTVDSMNRELDEGEGRNLSHYDEECESCDFHGLDTASDAMALEFPMQGDNSECVSLGFGNSTSIIAPESFVDRDETIDRNSDDENEMTSNTMSNLTPSFTTEKRLSCESLRAESPYPVLKDEKVKECVQMAVDNVATEETKVIADNIPAPDVESEDGAVIQEQKSVCGRSNTSNGSEKALEIAHEETELKAGNDDANLNEKQELDKKEEGYVRIYYQNKNFMSSTVFRVSETTVVLDVRRSIAKKLSLVRSEFGFFVVVMLYASSASSARTNAARTLTDDELILPLLSKEPVETEGAEDDVRTHMKNRSRPLLKFVFKDVRGVSLDIEDNTQQRSVETPVGRKLSVPTTLGTGIHCGFLQKASTKNASVWRKRWFVVKDDQLLYCKSNNDQRDVTCISLLNAYLAKARPELRVPYAFELRTPRRIYQLCTTSKSDMLTWIHALHVQIGISTENHRIYQAEILISEDAVNKAEEHATVSVDPEPNLLHRILSKASTRKLFHHFVRNSSAQVLLNTWTDCENFRRQGIARESARMKRAPKDAWDNLKQIIHSIQHIPVIRSKDAMELQEAFQSEQINRRLSLALHADSKVTEYPPFELLAPVQLQLYQALEKGPFRDFIARRGYRQILERVLGRFV